MFKVEGGRVNLPCVWAIFQNIIRYVAKTLEPPSPRPSGVTGPGK